MAHFIPRTTNFLLENKITYYFQALGSFLSSVNTGKANSSPGLPRFSGTLDAVYLETLKEFVCSLN